MKIILAIVTFIVSAIPLYLALKATNPVWQSYLAGLSSSLVVLGIGIVAVNFYLENSSRREAVKALFMLSQEAIANFHNEWIDLCWAVFGRDDFGRIAEEFKKSNLDANALKKENREKMYKIYADSPMLQKRVIELENMLSELTRMVGWNLDAKLLGATLLARMEIMKLTSITFDGSDDSITQVTTCLFKIDGTTGSARITLMKLAGITNKDN